MARVSLEYIGFNNNHSTREGINPMNTTRRTVLKGATASSILAGLIAAGALRPTQVLAADWNKAAFDAKDQPVINFLDAQGEVTLMREDIHRFVATWLPSFIRDNRNYLTVAIGCTGGQHRSVYIAEWLARQFADRVRVLVRHRTLAGD